MELEECEKFRKIYFKFDGMNDNLCKISFTPIFKSKIPLKFEHLFDILSKDGDKIKKQINQVKIQ